MRMRLWTVQLREIRYLGDHLENVVEMSKISCPVKGSNPCSKVSRQFVLLICKNFLLQVGLCCVFLGGVVILIVV